MLGAAPLAALWGPSPVARAGGRCLDVLRLLRITTSSPAVEATSIRCQGMLEALRGRFDSARQKFETSRTTARDLGLRHGLYETELFEGFVELIAGDPVAAEPHLVLARDGLGALGIGADAGQASALLARALLRQGRVDEADVLATGALETAGENLQTAVASRSVLGEIRVEQGRFDEARQLIAAALDIVERMDITIDHAIAQRSAARVADRLGNTDEAHAHRAAAERLLADKGVTGLAETRPEPAVATADEPGDTADDGATQRASVLPPNAAWEVNEGLFSTWIAGDRSGYLRLLAPDFQARIHELGPKLAFSGDRDATADVLFESLVDDRIHAIPNRLIATRGDDLALIAMTFQDGVSSTTMYTVSQVRDGRAVRADTFAEDQLDDALDELDRQWIELGGSPVIAACWAQWRRTFEPGNVDQPALPLTDDFIDVDHRELGKGRRTRGEYVESIAPLATVRPVVIPAEIVEWSDHAALARVSMVVTETGATWEMWAISVYRDGLVQRNENFGIDAFDAARARYDILSGESPSGHVGGRVHPATENRSSRAVDAFIEAINAGDADGMGRFLHPDYRMTFRFRFADPQEPLDGIQTIDNFSAMFEQGLTITSDVLAVRGDDLCLSHVNIGGPTGVSERYVLNRTSDGLSIEGISYDGDQLGEALDELDRQWVELGGPNELVELQRQVRQAVWHGDADLARRHLLPGFMFHDRRRLGIGAMNRADYLSSSFTRRGGVAFVIAEYLEYTGSATLTRDRLVNPDGSEWEHFAVMRFEPSGYRSADLFGLDDLDAARSHFDQLTNAGDEVDQHQATAISRDDPEGLDAGTISNTAWVISQQAIEALDRWDREAFVGLLSEHLETIDHERFSLAHGVTRNLDEYVALIFDRHDLLAGSTTTGRPVAIRDDDLCLLATTRTTDGYVIERLVVLETRGGRIVRFDWFDADDLVGALDELDRRWVARGGPAEEVRLAIAWRNAQHAGDIEAARHVLSPDFVMTDHCRLGVGRLGIDDHLTTSVRGARGVVAIPVEYVAHTDSAALARTRFTTPDESEWEQWVVTSVGGGLTRSVDLFDPDDLAAARARFEELAPDVRDEPSVFSNHAWEVTRAFGDALLARDRATAGGLLADTFESTSRERFDVGARLDGEMFLDAMFDTYLAEGEVEVAQHLRAIRGDTWCVMQLSATFGSGAVVERVCVSSVRGGQIESFTWYEVADLHDAMDELERKWTAIGGRADPVAAAIARSLSNGPFDTYVDCFAHDFVCVDHRELGFGVRLRDQLLETTDPLVAQVTDLVQEYLAVGDGISLSRIEMSSNIDGSVWPFWLINQHDGERAVGWEEFAIDQRSRALARYHELTGTADVGGTDADQCGDAVDRGAHRRTERRRSRSIPRGVPPRRPP